MTHAAIVWQRWQSVSSASALASIIARTEFPAGSGTPFVDMAEHLPADLAAQRGTASRRLIGAPHPGDARRDLIGKTVRHGATLVYQLLHGEVDAKRGATRATVGATQHVANAISRLCATVETK